MSDYWMKIRIGFRKYWLGSVAALGLVVMPANAVDPKVSNIQASQRAGTRLVDITYDVIDPDSPTLQIALEASDNSGASYLVPIVTVSGDVGHGVKPGTGKKITWDAANDWPNNYSSKMRFRVMASDVWLPSRGMVHVPEGIFTMGDERVGGARVLRSIRLSGFAMDRTEVTHAKWTEVRRWALARGYDLTMGLGNGTNHPVVGISWFDALKWCNARSEKEGLEPVYYVDAEKTQVYRTGDVVATPNWGTGYRLPTEAEWEKAARGGVNGWLYPWAGSDEIQTALLNYRSSGFEKTTPVGSYPSNGYGLFDMAGNVTEWCWDMWENAYPPGSAVDPRGPTEGSPFRHVRGGSWADRDGEQQVASRRSNFPDTRNPSLGFRTVLSQGQP